MAEVRETENGFGVVLTNDKLPKYSFTVFRVLFIDKNTCRVHVLDHELAEELGLEDSFTVSLDKIQGFVDDIIYNSNRFMTLEKLVAETKPGRVDED